MSNDNREETNQNFQAPPPFPPPNFQQPNFQVPPNYPPNFPQEAAAPQEPGPRPKTHLVWAILTTLFCFLPFGIVSIVYAARVDSFWASRRYDEAYRSSRLARNWALAAALCWGVGILLYFGLFLLAGLSGNLA